MATYLLDPSKSKNSSPNAVAIDYTRLRVTITDNVNHNSWCMTNLPLPKDKVYWEAKIYNAAGESGGRTTQLGIGTIDYANYISYYADRGTLYPGDRGYGATYAEGDVMGIAYDYFSNSITYYKNGVSQGTIATGILSGMPVYPIMGNYYPSACEFNFGGTAFKYAIPSGYRKLNDSQLLLIKAGNAYYTYNSSSAWEAIEGTITESTYLSHGITDLSIISESGWKFFESPIELCCYTDNPSINTMYFNIETEPYTLAGEWEGKTVKVIEYTDNPTQTESIISTEVEPIILYDELGDNIDVLYYTDELTKTAAYLEYSANYSPLDDIRNNLEVVTWIDESNNPPNLSLGALPVNQFIKQSNDFTLPGSLQAITIVKSASDNAKFLLSFDSGLTWKAYRYGKWTEVIVDDMNTIKKQAMSYKEISKLVESNFKNQGDKIRIGYYIEDRKQEFLNPTKIDATQFVIKSNVDSTKFQNLSFYVLNTEATIQITFNSGKILGQINDDDKGKVQYRVILNDLPYFPNDGSFTRLAPSPVDINLNISERDMHFDKDNKLRVEFKDYWGNTDYWQTTFAGTYTGLMFMDESGEYLSDTFGGILKYLDFGMVFAGQTTLDQKVVIKNQLGYPIDNLLLEVNKEKLPEGVSVELSRTQSPFLATDYITYGLTKPLETQEFYVRIVADIEAKPVPNGIFELKINSNKAAV
ncbi:SPRY domain-containing protein [Paenibacillus sp. CMAA1739]|uniref:SPRY domain-containing protein n=1 Tax=Paenibacillus ottowii TaxID=2315729 RepID=UPI002DBF9241|nr:SPRY domain-containing protein [Paenibacillus sp. CMAA1739]MEC4565310.1 SPRY domain-containing protein [Paenibacillus sp. CMAA1739]